MLHQIKKTVRTATKLAGFDLHPYSKTNWKWGYGVDEYYPVDPKPRWGFGNLPHAKLAEVIERDRANYVGLIQAFSGCHDIFSKIPLTSDELSTTPYWQNVWFKDLDAVSLIGILASRKPMRYFEIGSGNSTKFARFAINHARLQTTITSLDPNPRSSIDTLCDNVIRQPLEESDLSLFDQLQAGDVLFFDGSHRAFTNSDVTVFFLELLPRLQSGVIVQIHDIFLPWDYPPHWNRRLYSEQYILAAMMLCPQQPFKILLPNWFAGQDERLRAQVEAITKPLGCTPDGYSFWLETL
jgi:Methyltransferase domain